MGARSAAWNDHNIPHGPAGSANFLAGCDIVATFAAFSASHCRGASHKWSRLGGVRRCMLKHMWDDGYPGVFPDRRVMCEQWAIPALVEIREHQPPVGGWGSGGAEAIIAKLEEHRLARAAAAPGVAPSTFQNQPNSTANGLSAARRFLDYWCTLDAVERAENQAFRDWHAANIKP